MRPTLSRRLALATVTALGLGTATLVAATPAQAADWTTVLSVDKATTQLCRKPAAGGIQIRIRLDNRRADHAHLAGISRNGGAEASVRARAGELSSVKSLVVRTGDHLVVGMGEITGEGLGDDVALSSIRPC